MDRHTVGTDLAKMAIRHIDKAGKTTQESLAVALNCGVRQAGRVLRALREQGLVVKCGKGVRIRPSGHT
jgi:ribosomal protein S25